MLEHPCGQRYHDFRSVLARVCSRNAATSIHFAHGRAATCEASKSLELARMDRDTGCIRFATFITCLRCSRCSARCDVQKQRRLKALPPPGTGNAASGSRGACSHADLKAYPDLTERAKKLKRSDGRSSAVNIMIKSQARGRKAEVGYAPRAARQNPRAQQETKIDRAFRESSRYGRTLQHDRGQPPNFVFSDLSITPSRAISPFMHDIRSRRLVAAGFRRKRLHSFMTRRRYRHEGAL